MPAAGGQFATKRKAVQVTTQSQEGMLVAYAIR